MIKKIVFLIVIVAVGCNTRHFTNLNKSNINAECNRIIIMDSIDSKTINFVVSFENRNRNDSIVLFANSCYKKNNKDLYSDAGVILKKDNFTTPVGIFVPKVICIAPNETKNIVFIYSEQFPNKWLDIENPNNIREELTTIANNFSLFYKYNSVEMDKIFEIEEIKNMLSVKTINEDFSIKINNPTIEYNNDLTLEDIVSISGGKVINK